MNPSTTSPVIVGEAASGDTPESLHQLVALAYHELRAIAHSRLAARGAGGGTLSTTALVHEAYLKLVGQSPGRWRDRSHFFAVASLVTRAARFFLVAALLKVFGPPLRTFIERYLTLVTTALLLLIVGGFVALKYV